ncbi:MAG: hypothetical protein CM1200mP30_30500 [Pseudomonadota bacterium]|nr:MAG: hypothetical protein CM1200mP30_30500 [Pseudomonadota bacterium]
MLLLESGAFEFYWLWAALIWPLPFLFRLLPPRKVTAQALRVPFFERIADLPQEFYTESIFKIFNSSDYCMELNCFSSNETAGGVGEAVEFPLNR